MAAALQPISSSEHGSRRRPCDAITGGLFPWGYLAHQPAAWPPNVPLGTGTHVGRNRVERRHEAALRTAPRPTRSGGPTAEELRPRCEVSSPICPNELRSVGLHHRCQLSLAKQISGTVPRAHRHDLVVINPHPALPQQRVLRSAGWWPKQSKGGRIQTWGPPPPERSPRTAQNDRPLHLPDPSGSRTRPSSFPSNGACPRAPT